MPLPVFSKIDPSQRIAEEPKERKKIYIKENILKNKKKWKLKKKRLTHLQDCKIQAEELNTKERKKYFIKKNIKE